MRARTAILALCGLLVAAAAPTRGQGDALPETAPFFSRTRTNLERAQREQRAFAYQERRTELRLNPFGRMGTGGILVYDVRPLPDGGTERRLVERDGRPVDDAPLERRGLRARRPARRSAVDDAVNVLSFSLDGRVTEGGRSLVRVRFRPKPGASAETREGSLARRFAGVIFVDEALHEVVRVEAEAVEDLTYGFGMVARLEQGAQVRVTRGPVGADVWMPASIRFTGRGRALMFRRLDLDHTIEWFNYRRLESR